LFCEYDTIDGKTMPFGLRPTKAFAAETSVLGRSCVGSSGFARFRASERYRRVFGTSGFGERLLSADCVEKLENRGAPKISQM
jgi:hypothetical protein